MSLTIFLLRALPYFNTKEENLPIAWICRVGFRKDKVQNELRLVKRILKIGKKNSKNSKKLFFPDNFRIRSKNSQSIASKQHKCAAH